LNFASISKKISLLKLSLHFNTFVITVPHYSISIGAFAVSERVYTKEPVCITEAYAPTAGVYTKGA
jgi:hypothetical protein